MHRGGHYKQGTNFQSASSWVWVGRVLEQRILATVESCRELAHGAGWTESVITLKAGFH